jgi:osmoprotectant transport system permease protein
MTRLRLVAWFLAALAALAPRARAADLTVGSKNFSESRLLAELFAQLIESQTELTVERRLNLAGTAICFGALQSGDLDLYPEYTGTGLVTLLGLPAGGTPAEVLRTVRREFRARYDMVWLAPLGFENSYELAVPRAVAERHQLGTISDLVAVAPRLDAAFGYEFAEREDGLVGLRRTYGLNPGSVVGMQQTLKYDAAGKGRIDLLDVYTTDGLILVHDLVVLEDDRGVFPPYAAAPLVRGETLRRHPQVAAALQQIAGLLDEATMRELNRRAEVDQEPVASVARSFLQATGLVEGRGTERSPAASAQSGRERSWLQYSWAHRESLAARALEHLGLVGLSLVLGVLVAVPMGLLLERRRGSAEGVIRGVGVIQTIPSIALLAFMIPLLGVGPKPAIAALFLYALFPIVRNTYTGVRDADPVAAESAKALGMTPRQVLLQVRLPLAVPVLLAGVRTSAVINVGTATLAAFIGAGGLGQPIVAGLQLNDSAIVLSGAVPAALLALAVDGGLGLVEKLVRPKGL